MVSAQAKAPDPGATGLFKPSDCSDPASIPTDPKWQFLGSVATKLAISFSFPNPNRHRRNGPTVLYPWMRQQMNSARIGACRLN